MQTEYMYIPEQSVQVTPKGDVEKVVGLAHLSDAEIKEYYRAHHQARVEIVRADAH